MRPRRAEAIGQLDLRRRARSRDDAARRLDRRRRPRRRRARRPRPLQRAAGGLAEVESAVARGAPVLRSAGRRADARPRLAARLAALAAASRATTCAASMPRFPLGCLTAVTGVSGSGKSSLVSQALLELVCRASRPRHRPPTTTPTTTPSDEPRDAPPSARRGRIAAGMERLQRLVCVDQKPIGRTPRSNLATYTGLFDPRAQAVRRDAGGEEAALRRRPLLVQRRQGPLPDLRGRRLRQRRAAVPAERVCAVPDLPRRALQREDAGRDVARAATSPTSSR